MQLVVWQIGERTTRDTKRIVELIVRIVHLIYTEHGLQTTFIKGLVMGHKGQTFYQWLYLCPDLWEYWCFLSILTAEAMYLAAPVIIIVWLGLNERIE
jgi:hypothetical protein